MNKSLRLEDLEVYKIAREIGKSFGIRKAKTRNLVSDEEFILLNEKLDIYFRLKFGYINSIGSKND